jgi:hypothetical protein
VDVMGLPKIIFQHLELCPIITAFRGKGRKGLFWKQKGANNDVKRTNKSDFAETRFQI